MNDLVERRGLSWRDFRALALIAAGMTAISGHVGLGLSVLGPLAILPTIAIAVAVVCAVLVMPSRGTGLGGLLAVAIALVIVTPGFLRAGHSEYASDKVAAMLTIMLPILVVVALVARRVDDVDWFLLGLSLLAVVGVLIGFFEMVSGIDIGVRGSDVASALNPIAAGRLAGSLIIWLGLGRVSGLAVSVRLALGLASAAVLLGAASRGPLLALIVAVGVTGIAARAIRGKLAVAVVLVGLALVGGVGNTVLQESGDRLLEADEGAGPATRSNLWSLAVDNIALWPEGIGWGQFNEEGTIGAAADYPHNLLLEIALEAGLLAAVCFAMLAVAVGRKLWDRVSVDGPVYLALFVFWLTTAMFSSDVNGNRVTVILVLALFIALRAEAKGASTPMTESASTDNGVAMIEAGALAHE